MSNGRFFDWETLGDANDDDLCVLENFIEGAERQAWRIHEGEPIGSFTGPKATIRFDGDEPGIKLASLVGNVRHLLIVSTKLADVIKTHTNGVPIEYLPLAIYDHRKRLMSDDYVVVNPLGSFDCIDLKKSDVLWSDDTPPKVLDIDTIVLDKSKCADAPALFRPEHDRSTYVIRYELGRAMHESKATNLMFKELRVL